MLQLSRSRNNAGIAIDKLLPFVENELEHKLIQLFHATRPDLFVGCKNPLKALFLLRAIYIPRVCRGLIFNEGANRNESVVWLGALGAYSVAYERTLFERLFRAKGQAKILPNGGEQYVRWATAKFGGSILNWFDDTREGYEFWLSRFEQWHEYAIRSLDHWLGCQSIDYRRATGKMKLAAQLGILKNLDALPEDRVTDLLDNVNAVDPARKMFQKNAKKRTTNPSNLEFDSWLIECWPLVLEYGWNYREIQLVASRRFEEDQIKLGFTAEAVKERCQILGLKLKQGSNKVGRPKVSTESTLPPMAQVAVLIDGLVDHADWFWGKADGGFKDFENLLQQS